MRKSSEVVWVPINGCGTLQVWCVSRLRRESKRRAANEAVPLSIIEQMPDHKDRWNWLKKRGWRTVKARLALLFPEKVTR